MKEIFENKHSNVLFTNNLARVRYNLVGGLFNNSSPNEVKSNHQSQTTKPRGKDEPAITDKQITTIRSFEELDQLTKGQGWNGSISKEVFQALSEGKEVRVALNQSAPERANLLTPMVTAVMALMGGLSGAAYNDKLMTGIGNDIRKAAEFVRKFGTNYQLGLGTGQHIDRTAEFTVVDRDNKKEKQPELNSSDFRDWNYTSKPKPRPLNTSVANNFDRVFEYTQVEMPVKEKQYIPPYLNPELIKENNTVDAFKMAEILNKLGRGNLSEGEKGIISDYMGKEINFNNFSNISEVFNRIKGDITSSMKDMEDTNPNKAKITEYVKSIEEFETKPISNLESTLSEFGSKDILSTDGIKTLENELKSVFKEQGIDISNLLKQDGSLDMNKVSEFIRSSDISEPLKNKLLDVSEKAITIIDRTKQAGNLIGEYNESIAEDENFTPEIRDALINSGIDISILKNKEGKLDPIKVFKLAALIDEPTQRANLGSLPEGIDGLIGIIKDNPELNSKLKVLGKNVNSYDKLKTNEQEFVQVLKTYGEKIDNSYDRLQGKEKLDESRVSVSGVDVYSVTVDISSGGATKTAKDNSKILQEAGQKSIDLNDTDNKYTKAFNELFNSIDGKVLFNGKNLTPTGKMTKDFLQLAANAGIISKTDLEDAKSGKALAQLFLKTELELHNRYGLKIDGQLGAEHMTDITHALRNKVQSLTTTANLLAESYMKSTDGVMFNDSESQLDGDEAGKTNRAMLKGLILENEGLFKGKDFGGVKFDGDVDKFLAEVLDLKNSEKAVPAFLEAIKVGLKDIQSNLKGNNFLNYGQAAEIMDDIDFVITGVNKKTGKTEDNAGIDAMMNYVNDTKGIGKEDERSLTGETYLKQISASIDRISNLPANTPIKLGKHEFKNVNEAMNFLFDEYQKVLLSGVPIKSKELSPDAMADKFTEAFKKTSGKYDDVRALISLIGEANDKPINFEKENISVDNTPANIMKKQVDSLPDSFKGSKEIKSLMLDIVNTGDKEKMKDLLQLLKDSSSNFPNDTIGEENAKKYLAMTEKLLKKTGTDFDLTGYFKIEKDKDKGDTTVAQAFKLALEAKDRVLVNSK